LPNCPIAHQKIKVDNNARFCYQVGCWFRLIEDSICEAKADADTQLTVFDLSTLKKQLLIFLTIKPALVIWMIIVLI
jgi:hypothetical protein